MKKTKIEFRHICRGDVICTRSEFADLVEYSVGVAHRLREDGLCWLTESGMLLAGINDDIYIVEGGF